MWVCGEGVRCELWINGNCVGYSRCFAAFPVCFVADDELLVGASSLSGRYWFGSLHYYGSVGGAVNNEKYSAAVQLQSGLSDALWVDACHVLVGLDTGYRHAFMLSFYSFF